MMDKFAIFDYAEKGALADYEKACMMYKLFQDEKSKAAMDDALGTAREIRRLHEAEIDKMKVAKAPQAEEPQAEAPQAEAPQQTQQAQQVQGNPLDYTVNVEYASGRKVNFHLDDKDMARHAYDSVKTMAKRLPGVISRVALVQHNTDKSEIVLASMDIG